MNYELLYDKIIAKAKTELRKKTKGIYFESHHIIPRCIGGDNKKTNLVLLTAKEHFLCHKILCEIYPLKQGIKFAFWRMVTKKEKGTYQKVYKIGCREYERIKKEIALIQSERKKGKPFTDAHKQNISKNKKGKKSPGSGIYLRTKSRKG